MQASLVQMIASILSYLAARGVDVALGKWVAYFTIAWEKVATQEAIRAYNETKEEMITAMPEKWREWENWRNTRGE